MLTCFGWQSSLNSQSSVSSQFPPFALSGASSVGSLVVPQPPSLLGKLHSLASAHSELLQQQQQASTGGLLLQLQQQQQQQQQLLQHQVSSGGLGTSSSSSGLGLASGTLSSGPFSSSDAAGHAEGYLAWPGPAATAQPPPTSRRLGATWSLSGGVVPHTPPPLSPTASGGLRLDQVSGGMGGRSYMRVIHAELHTLDGGGCSSGMCV